MEKSEGTKCTRDRSVPLRSSKPNTALIGGIAYEIDPEHLEGFARDLASDFSDQQLVTEYTLSVIPDSAQEQTPA